LADWQLSWENDRIKVSENMLSRDWIYRLTKEPCCKDCGKTLIRGKYCWDDYRHRKLLGADGVFHLGYYFPDYKLNLQEEDDILRQHILRLKNNSEFAKPIGIAMTLAIKHRFRVLLDSDLFIPVPSYGEEFNPSKALCNVISENVEKLEGKKIIVYDAIKKIKDDKLHLLSSRREMEEVVNGMYTSRDDISVKNKNMTIIDDTLTTGITKSECIRILKQYGAAKIWVFVAGGTI